MSIKVALEHRTTYRFDRPIDIGPHVIRLRPAPHTRTPIEAYSLSISPATHFINWQQDPFGNYLARVVFPEKADELDITVGLVADLEVINPFDFFVEEYAETFPFSYARGLRADLEAYLAPVEDAPGLGLGPVLTGWLDALPIGKPGPDGTVAAMPIVDFLVALNAAVYGAVGYSVRMEQGVQTPDETLTRAIGSCRDSAWLLVAALRHFGLAARFVSGYLVQLTSDSEPLEGPGGPKEDFTDLHAWAEVFVPGAGWIGLDPTSALFAGEGHIPLAATPHPSHASPISGATEPTQVEFAFHNTVSRFHEDPRVTKPYTPEQVAHIQEVGVSVDKILDDLGLDLTMGGEPTFVSIDDMTSPQWTVAADGPEKRRLANDLAVRLFADVAPGGLIQRSQGKWYPGEPLPRWQIGLIWRTDGEPLWTDPALLADPFDPSSAGENGADENAAAAAEQIARLVTSRFGLPDEALQACYEDPFAALAGEVGLPEGPKPSAGDDPIGIEPALVSALDADLSVPSAWALPLTPAWWGNGWASARWRFRRGRLVLLPGDSPAGARMPLSSVNWKDPEFEGEEDYTSSGAELDAGTPEAVVVDPDETPSRTALVIEARDGIVHLYLPPLEKLEKFAELIGLLDDVVREVGVPVVFEGYGPPPDARAKVLMVTPDPGVIEVNVHPTSSWTEFAELTAHLYETARQCRLGTETFGLDGRHSGTGGGNHITLGGSEPSKSPLLQRPDLLVSMLTYWQHHPSLSYLFSGRFVGPTSQAPRVDEGRPETLYELEIAFAEVERLVDRPDEKWDHRPWAVDRALRHLLTDITGNTHRAEFCIDKMYSPDSSRGRLGLLELRGFEMPPHPDMALVQALLVRSILARSAVEPYRAPLIRWGTRLHERFLLPHFVAGDLADIVADLRRHHIDIDLAWFDPYLEFRFPRIGFSQIGDATLELRSAIEPWNVLGEESSSGGTARYVDSSVERVQVLLTGLDTSRYAVTCNGRPVPLQSTGTPGTYVAGVRYKAWKPWSALHPTLEIDTPLVFDVVDLGNRLSLGGATYHVVHPGGRSYDHPPVNAKEAEARRSRRFEASGHTTGVIDIDAIAERAARRGSDADDYPLTLDLRRRTPRRWGRG